MRCAAVERNACPHMGPVLEACILSQLRSDRASEVRRAVWQLWMALLVRAVPVALVLRTDGAGL